jgi:hypothetical protein
MSRRPASNSLVHLAKDRKDQWYFVSVKGDGTLRLRLVPKPNLTPDLDGVAWDYIEQEFDVSECFSRGQLAERFGIPASDVAWKHFGTLVSIVARLESGRTAKMIPVTEMRTFYEWLRDRPEGINKLVLHSALAKWFTEQPSLLMDSFFKSLGAFATYSNPDEDFTPRSNCLAVNTEKELRATDLLVNTLVEKYAGQIDASFANIDFGATAVAREVGPMRSTEQSGPWFFEDGRSARNPGAGGVDLLLSSNSGMIPVICEIKVRDDATPFYALIQTLTYAAELATPNQYQRLKNVFRSAFHTLSTHPLVDICILMQDSPTEHKCILEDTKAIVRGMYRVRPELTSIIRRIVFLKARDDGGLTFAVDAFFPSPL